MRFGQFDDERREYVISRPDTPLPWINYLGSEDYFGIISNTAGGYSFYRDARLRRLTRYRYNNAPLDLGGRYLYLRDEADGQYWSPTWQPTRSELEDYELPPRPGLHDDRLAAGGDPGRDHLFRAARRDARDLARAGHQRAARAGSARRLRHGRVLPVGRAGRRHELPAQLLDRRGRGRGRRDLPQDRVPRTARSLRLLRLLGSRGRLRYVSATPSSGRIAAGTGRSRSSAGRRRARSRTAGSRSARTRRASSWPRAKPARSPSCSGYAENPADAKFDPPGSGTLDKRGVRPTIDALPRSGGRQRVAWRRCARYWDGLLGVVAGRDGHEHADRMVNIWNAYQCMVTFNMSRSASLFESGIGRGMGFRDSNQDLLGFVHMVPERARERILDIAATQLPTGGAYHQYQPLTKRGNDAVGVGLQRRSGLARAGGLRPTPRRRATWRSWTNRSRTTTSRAASGPSTTTSGAAIDYTLERLGPHGLPLIGRADWNDCLNLNCFSDTPGESFQTTQNREGGVAESVFIAGLFVLAAERAGRHRGAPRRRGGEPARYRAGRRADGRGGRRARLGWRVVPARVRLLRRPVGSAENAEGQIFIEPQGICVMAGIGLEDGPGRQRRSRSVRERLATAARHRAAAAGLLAVLPQSRRDLVLPARLQGERAGSSATRTRG